MRSTSSPSDAPSFRRKGKESVAAPASNGATSLSAITTDHRFRAWHVAALLLLLTTGALLLYGFWPTLTGPNELAERVATEDLGKSVTSIETVVAEPARFSLRAEATGHLASWRRALISAQGSGLITQRHVGEGQYVREGALLFQLDDRNEHIELEEAKAQLLKARATYVVNTRGIEDLDTSRDTVAVESARSRSQRAEEAYKNGVITEEELEEARRRLDIAEVLDGGRRNELYAINAGVMEAQQRIERAELALSRTQIRAPFSGRVADLSSETGQRVASGEALCTLLDNAPMKVEVDVLEEDLVRIEDGNAALVRVPSLAEENAFEGTVRSINPSVDPAVGTGRVTVTIPNSEGRLVAGLFAEVAIETRRLEDQIALPANAVLERQGRELVFVVQGGRAQWTYVTTGARSGDRVVVTEGLSPGDTVAVSGHFALAHDVPVEIQNAQPAPIE